MLSDPEKKAIYDQCGEEGLSGAPPEGGSGGFPGGGGFSSHGFSGFPGGGGGGSMHFSQANAEDIFRSFFGTTDPFSAGGMGGGGMGMGGIFEDNGVGDRFGGRATRARATAQRKATPTQHDLNVSLEDLYNGTVKRIRITKKITSPTGEIRHASVEKEIQIKVGWKEGTKITYENEGDEMPGVIPADIVFTLRCKPHPVYARDGDNLLLKIDVKLEEAMRGLSTSIKTLDGRTIPLREPFVTPQTTKTISGEGMMNTKVRNYEPYRRYEW